MRDYLAMIAGGLEAVAAIVGLSFVLSHFGLSDPRIGPRALADWLLTRGVKIVVIVVAALAVVRAARLAIAAIQHRFGSGSLQRDLEWQRRASTLGGILTRLVTSVVWFVALLMLLRELAIDVLPVLTGAGIAGLAIGFGAQNLVRDVISGFFLILEDQIRVGDSARINGVGGTIEGVNLRTIVLRDGEGAVHVFPNGTVTSLANLSKQFSFAIVDVRVAYAEDLDRVFGAIREVGEAMQSDPALEHALLDAIEVVGVESIAHGHATIRSKFRTRPLQHRRVANELRRRLLATLAAKGIKPYATEGP
ncbi:MAG: mechanosensitive ion channel family protein [Acidobacteriota bacterium]